MQKRFARRVMALVSLLFLVTVLCNAQSFKGTMSDISMNDKTYPAIKNIAFKLTKTASDTGILTAEPLGIGKMPGKLHFSIPVKIAQNGTITPNGKSAGKMKMAVISSSLNIQKLTGSITNKQLHFTLHTTGGMLGMKMADAWLTFDGTM